jgi:hypothetical protein
MEYNTKKAQNSFEFVIILVFILTVIGIMMFYFGQYTVDAKEQEIIAEINDFKESIDSEIDLLSNVEKGYSRVVDIPKNLMNRFNLTINSTEGFMVLTDRESYGSDTDKVYHYEIPKGFDIKLDPKPDGSYDLLLVKGTFYSPSFVDLDSNVTITYPSLTDYRFYWNKSLWSSCSVSCGMGIESKSTKDGE